MHPFHVIIPARYASIRLPGKPLVDIAGKPMVVWVAERAKQSGAKQVIVATDHQDILKVVEAHGYQAVMTGPHHISGTDRIAEVTAQMALQDNEIIVNVQGDEPLIPPSLIADTAEVLRQSTVAVMSTACHPMHSEADWLNPNAVKVVLNKFNHALYFSRASIPFPRDADTQTHQLKQQATYRHIGIYGYRAHFLNTYANLSPAAIERIESLEQLRALYEGYQIAVNISTVTPPPGVDSKADLELVRQIIASNLLR
jgi:3-deoxy-manno-octulosonate cytidylyltransferase (CMP-KDO synthetase)